MSHHKHTVNHETYHKITPAWAVRLWRYLTRRGAK